MNKSNITSIGWLNAADGSVNLTPCINGSSMPVWLNISRDEFEILGGCKEKMKEKAIELMTRPN